MTHCSCSLCQTCFKTFFLSAIKEKSIDQLVCPQCGRPEIRGQMEESMEYFNLLDTQVGGHRSHGGCKYSSLRNVKHKLEFCWTLWTQLENTVTSLLMLSLVGILEAQKSPLGLLVYRSVTSCLLISTNYFRGNSETEPCRRCQTSAGVLM